MNFILMKDQSSMEQHRMHVIYKLREQGREDECLRFVFLFFCSNGLEKPFCQRQISLLNYSLLILQSLFYPRHVFVLRN